MMLVCLLRYSISGTLLRNIAGILSTYIIQVQNLQIVLRVLQKMTSHFCPGVVVRLFDYFSRWYQEAFSEYNSGRSTVLGLSEID